VADRKVTFLIIARDFASRTLKNVGDSTDVTAQKLRNLNTLGLSPVATAGAALGPALLPVVAGATVGAIGLGTAFLGAGAAAAVFGGVVKTVVTDVVEASKKSDDLRTKIALLQTQQKMALAAGDTKGAKAFGKQEAAAVAEYRARLATLPAPMRAAVVGMDGMKTAWQGFVTANSTPVLGLMARGMNLVRAILPSLQPLFNVASTAASGLMGVFERFVAGGGIDDVVGFLSARAGPAFTAFGHILVNLGIGVGALLSPFALTSDGIVGGLDRMSGSFRIWAATAGQAGMERILAFAREQGPGAAAALWELAKSVGTIAVAAAPLAPVSAAIASALARIIQAMPPGVLTALVGGFIAWNVALRASAILLRGQLILGGLVGIYTGISAAVRGVALAENASAVATRANAVATWAMNSALLASPITWVVVALVALAVGLIYAYKHSETFRRIVQGALAGVVAAGRALLGFFQGIPAFFSGMWATVTGAFTTSVGWIQGRMNALGGWFTALPGRIMAGIIALPGLWWSFWTSLWERAAYLLAYGIGLLIRGAIRLPGLLRAAIFASIVAVGMVVYNTWNGAKAKTVAGINALVAFARTLPGKARSAIIGLLVSVGNVVISTWNGAKSRTIAGVNAVVAYFRQLPGKARSAIAGLPGQIRSVFSGAGSWLLSAGADIVRGLTRGIANAMGAAIGEAKRIASNIVSGFKHGLGIGSPSRVMADEVGRWIPPGILAGINAAAPGLMSGVGGMMGDLVGAASRPIVGQALLSAEGYANANSVGTSVQAGGGEVLQPIQLVVDGKVLQQVLLRLKRQNGGRELGLG
jgi:hypothetical protein